MAIDKLNIHSSGKNKTEYRNVNNKFFQDNAFFNGISCYGVSNKNLLFYQLNETSNMADFYKLQSSPLSLPNGRDYFFSLVL